MTRIILAASALVLASAIIVHALFPRYELHTLGNDLARFDRWTGRVTVSQPGNAAWATDLRSLERQVTLHQIPDASGEELASAIPADADGAGGYRQPSEGAQSRNATPREARGIDIGRSIGRIVYDGLGNLLRRIEDFFSGQEVEAQEDTTNSQ